MRDSSLSSARLKNVSQSNVQCSGEISSRRSPLRLLRDSKKKESSQKVAYDLQNFLNRMDLENTDCRADQSWSEDGAFRPAQLSHSLHTYYWWQPKLGPQARLAQYQQPGMF